MKYLSIIIIIILCVTTLTLLLLRPGNTPPGGEALLTINGHEFSRSSIENIEHSGSYHSDSSKDQLETMITRELLIQEAQRQGIDMEGSFRIALKKYYEQSLIKILTDRKYSSLQTEISEQDIDSYLSNYGKIFTFSILSAQGSRDTQKERHSILFDDLSDSLAVTLSGMRPGETREQFDTGSSTGRIRLEHIAPASEYHPVAADREHLRIVLRQQKKEELISSWIKGLRDEASITVHQEADPHGQ